MRIGKKIKYLILGMLLVLFGSMVVYAKGTGVVVDRNSIPGEVAEPNIEVSAEKDGNAIFFSIQNKSGEPMNNVHLISRETNKMVSDEVCRDLGTVESGKSINTTVMVKEMNSYFRSWSVGLGGFSSFYIVALLIVAIVFVVIVRLRKNSNIRVSVGSVVFILAVFAFVVFSIGTRDTYKVLDTGNNYIRTLSVDSGRGYELEYYLKYNQDNITYAVTEEDVDTDFEVEYEYDEDVPCTDEPVVRVEGKKGKNHVVTTVKYRNGKEEDKLVEEKVLVKPEKQIEVQGTKTTIEIQNIDAKKEYVPDDTMKVGDYKLSTDLAETKENVGKKEVTYKWNNDKKKVESTEKVTKEPGTNIWKAGSLVINEEIVKAETKYVAREDQAVGWENVITESKDGVKTTVYKTKIDKKTGKPKKGIELEYYTTLEEEPINGEKEIGVLSIEEAVTEREVVYTDDDTKWNNEEIVTAEGQDKIEKVTKIMKLDSKKGTISDTVVREVSRELVQSAINKEVVRGTKEPNWVEEKKATGQVKYNTIYVPDESLSGDEQVVEVKGEMGRLITTQLIAVDEEGNRLITYQPKVMEEDSLQKPVDEIVHVAPDSNLLK